MRFGLLFLLFASLALCSQDFIDIVETEYSISRLPDDKTLSDFSFQQSYAKILFPKEINTRHTLLAGLEYKHLELDEAAVSSVALQLGDAWSYVQGRKVLLMLIPKLSSDFRSELVAEDLQIGGLVLLTHEQSERWSWKYGVYANTELFGPLLVPLIGMRYDINTRLRLDCTLPVSAELRKNTAAKHAYGIQYSGKRFSFRLSEQQRYLEFGDNGIWGFADLRLSEHLYLNLKAGSSVTRSFDLHPEGEKVDLSFGLAAIGDERLDQSLDVPDSFFGALGLSWRYFTP